MSSRILKGRGFGLVPNRALTLVLCSVTGWSAYVRQPIDVSLPLSPFPSLNQFLKGNKKKSNWKQLWRYVKAWEIWAMCPTVSIILCVLHMFSSL